MSAPRLHVLMACSRPQNIPLLVNAYLEQEPHPFEVRWHILRQGPEPDPKGIRKVNEMLDLLPGGWFMTVSDDTAQAPSLYRRLGEVIQSVPNAGAVVFSQVRKRGGWIQHAAPENMAPYRVCGGQVIWRRDFVGDKRFDFETHGDTCDGVFIQEMFQAHPEGFVFHDEPLMYFGSLEPGSPFYNTDHRYGSTAISP